MRRLRVTTVNRLRASDCGWLILAVCLHSALLLVPLADLARQERAGTDRQLSIVFSRLLQAKSEPRDAVPEPVSVAAKRKSLPNNPPAVTDAPAPIAPPAYQLIESIGRFDRFPTDQKIRRLGEVDASGPPRNWLPSITLEENRFDGMMRSDKTVIVDRWLAADGSHNVVIRTPGGETLCGRALPWDPMRPLVEPVMMYRSCGGGGTRSFDVPERYKRDLR